MKGSVTLKCNMLIYITVITDQRIFKCKPIRTKFNLHFLTNLIPCNYDGNLKKKVILLHIYLLILVKMCANEF